MRRFGLSAAVVVALALSTVVAPQSANAAIDVDVTYGNAGVLELPYDCSWRFTDLSVVADRSTVASELCRTRLRLTAVDASGHVNAAYGHRGSTNIKIPSSLHQLLTNWFLTPLPDGSCYVTFWRATSDKHANNTLKLGVIRVDGSGAVDEAFGTDGITKISVPEVSDAVLTPQVDVAGRLVLAAQRDGVGALEILRLDLTGGLDQSFGGDGRLALTPSRHFNDDWLWATTFGNQIYLGGNTQYRSGRNRVADATIVVRLRSNGRYDDAFSGDGVALLHASDVGRVDDANEFGVDAQGRVVMVVTRGTANTNSAKSLDWVRLDPAGRTDTAFSTATTPIRRGTHKYLLFTDFGFVNGHPVTSWIRNLSGKQSFATGLDSSGSRWQKVGPDGTAESKELLSLDAAGLRTIDRGAGAAIAITRLTVQGT